MYKYFAEYSDMRKIFTIIAILAGLCSCTPRDRFIQITGFAQGGNYAVKLNIKDVKIPVEEIQDSIDAILVNIDHSISGYNKNSLLSRFNEGEIIVVDSIFMDLYGYAYSFYEETGAVVDVAAAPLFDAWGFGFKNDSLPSAAQVVELLAASGMNRLIKNPLLHEDGKLSPADLLISNENASQALPRLNFNAIAQGYSCDKVAEYLYSLGVKDMMVDIGEIFCDGHNPAGRPWSIGIDRPIDGNDRPGEQMQGILRTPDGPHGIVSSGNYRKFYIRDGKKYAHTIDPRTGYPVDHSLLSATIIAPDAMTADAYATYCMVIGLEASIDFLSSTDDLEACLIYDKDGRIEVWCSDGFILEEPSL